MVVGTRQLGAMDRYIRRDFTEIPILASRGHCYYNFSQKLPGGGRVEQTCVLLISIYLRINNNFFLRQKAYLSVVVYSNFGVHTEAYAYHSGLQVRLRQAQRVESCPYNSSIQMASSGTIKHVLTFLVTMFIA